MKTGITLYRRLNEGITDGGADDLVQHWPTVGPRNLVAALQALETEHDNNIASYGDIGAGNTWIELCGVKLRESARQEILDMAEGYSDPGEKMSMTTAAQRCLTEWFPPSTCLHGDK